MSRISIAIAVAVLALKYCAFLFTGSVALYSDALESIINVAAAIAALVALRVAALPADAGHPFGHSKAEYLSAVLEGVLIVLAALLILWEALPKILNPTPIELSAIGLGLSIMASLLNGYWASRLLKVGKQERSPALKADGQHLMSDVITSAGVVIGVILAKVTDWYLLDPLLAALVALNILWSGWKLMSESVSGLMDAGVDAQTQSLIRDLVGQHADGALEVHDILTRSAGRIIFVEFHLVVPAKMTVEEAHNICDRLEMVLESQIEGARVTIHVEPQDKAKHSGIVVI